MKYFYSFLILLTVNTYFAQNKKALSHFKKGMQYVEKKNYLDAKNAFSQSIFLDSLNPIVYHNRRMAEVELKEYNNALLDFSKALSINNKLYKTYLERGKLYNLLKQYRSAEVDLRKFLSTDTTHSNAKIALAETLTFKGNFSEAIELLSEVIQSSNEAIEKVYANRGILYLKQNNIPEAISDLTIALEIDSTDEFANANLGIAYRKINENKSSELYLLKAIQNSNSSYYKYELSLTYTNSNQFERSIEILTELIQENATDKLYFFRANNYAQLNKFDNAKKDYDQALELNPAYLPALNNRVYYIWFKQGKYSNALEDLNFILKNEPTDNYALNNRGYAYYKLGQLENALADVLRSLDYDPKNAYAFKNLALIQRALGNISKSKDAAIRTKELHYPEKEDIEFNELVIELKIQ